MNRIIYIICFLAYFSFTLDAQESNYPQRTARDIALKQTKMLVNELGITDTVLCEKLFYLHLKYAQMRDINNTRSEALQRMMQIQEELKHILSPEQFAAFMNRQMDNRPRAPKPICNWIAPHSSHNRDTLPQAYEEEQQLSTPPESQL